MISQLSLYLDIGRFHWHAADLTSFDTKRRELKREIWKNTDTTSQGMHADPNRIRVV
jgi:hypothetical protein